MTSPHLRKAAVLVRSLDAETAASLLAQLSANEAAALRAAVQALGPIDPEERADVAAEFRRAAPIAAKPAEHGVELSFSVQSTGGLSTSTVVPVVETSSKRFEFLENAPTGALVPYLAREHAQTIAVVLSHLAPLRAATVLAALPQKLQAETVERLAMLGETDPESVVVVERELAEWMAKRSIGRPGSSSRSDSVRSILAAADATTRSGILANLKVHKAVLARRLDIPEPVRSAVRSARPARTTEPAPERESQVHALKLREARRQTQQRLAVLQRPLPQPALNFDELVHFDDQSLAGLLHEVDPNILALALAGSREEFIDRIAGQMPKRTGREFRRRLRQMGPTRLSDVEAAQHAVARIAARRLADSRWKRFASAT